MGFSGGGGGVLTNHTHDTAVTNDGGALAANATMFGLSAGSVLFSDGSNIQELGVGSASDVLAVNGAATAPEWVTPAGAGTPTSFFSFADEDFWGTNSSFWGAGVGYAPYPAWSYTESLHTIPVNTDLTFTRYQINLVANGKASNQVTAFRDDGADVGAITITASNTGTFDSGAVSVNIAAGSLIDWAYHGTVAGSVQFNVSLGTVTT